MSNIELNRIMLHLSNHKIKYLLVIILVCYAAFWLGVRFNTFNLCTFQSETYVAEQCSKVFVTRELELENRTYNKVNSVKSFNLPLFFLSEGLSDYFVKSQTLQEMKIPLIIEGREFISWSSIVPSGSSQGVLNVINDYKLGGEHRVWKNDSGYVFYKHLTSPASFFYLVPEALGKYPVYYRCGEGYVNCTAFSAMDSFRFQYSVPYDELERFGKIHGSILGLFSNFK
jgi:hypothetical protein